MHQLRYFNHDDPSHLQGWRTILVTAFEHPYMKNWWVPGCVIGYEHTFINALADFLMGLESGEGTHPSFREALATQKTQEAVLRSAQNLEWVTID
jgi:predicted dehydrogenase